MTYRMALALASLVDALVALYLHLWKTNRFGLGGTLVCGAGHGCEVAQFSSYGYFLGVDVALIGAVGWGVVFLVSVVGTQPRHEDEAWPTLALLALVVPALAFTLRLKYGEFLVLHTFCPWCAVNAVVVVVATVLVLLDWRRVRRLRGAGAPFASLDDAGRPVAP